MRLVRPRFDEYWNIKVIELEGKRAERAANAVFTSAVVLALYAVWRLIA